MLHQHGVQLADGARQLVAAALVEIRNFHFASSGALGSPLIVEHMFGVVQVERGQIAPRAH